METVIAWLDEAIKKMQIDEYLAKVGLTSHVLAQGVVFAGIACAIGFFFKRQFKFIIGWFIVTGAIYWILSYNNLMTVDWAGVRQFLGVSLEQTEVKTVVASLWCWITSNIFVVICTSIGLFLGYSIG